MKISADIVFNEGCTMGNSEYAIVKMQGLPNMHKKRKLAFTRRLKKQLKHYRNNQEETEEKLLHRIKNTSWNKEWMNDYGISYFYEGEESYKPTESKKNV